MEKPKKIDDTFDRIKTAQTIQRFIDNPFFLWKNGCTDEDLQNLKKYFRERDIPIPVMPNENDKRSEGIKRSIYLVWAALECNDSICSLMGCEE